MSVPVKYDYPLSSSGVNDQGSLPAKIAYGARELACELYSKYPDWVVSSGVVTPMKYLYDSLCGQEPKPTFLLPPMPTVQVAGGQCNTDYFYTFSHKSTNRNYPWYPQRTFETSSAYAGAFVKFGVEWDFNQYLNDGTGRYGYSYILTTKAGRVLILPNCVYHSKAYGSMAANSYSDVLELLSLRRKDGQPDNCGSLPPSYPNSPVPPGIEKRDLPVTGNDGTKLTVPLVFVKPTLNVNPKVMVRFNVNPEFNGTVNFDMGGITVDFGGGDTGAPVDLSQVYSKLDNLKVDTNVLRSDTGVLKSDMGIIKGDTNVIKDVVNQVSSDVSSVKDELSKDISLDYEDYDFDSEERVSEHITYRGLEGIGATISRVSTDLADIQQRINEQQIEIALPRRYIMGKGASIPQLVLVYRDVTDKNTFGKKRCQITIPYPLNPDALKSKDAYPESIRYYLHGAWEGLVMLPESEIRMTANCSDSDEAKRMIVALAQLCEPLQGVELNARFAERFDKENLTEYYAALRWVSYYSKGVKDAKPDWVLRFNIS